MTSTWIFYWDFYFLAVASLFWKYYENFVLLHFFKDKLISGVIIRAACFPFLSQHRGGKKKKKRRISRYLTESRRYVSPTTSGTEISHGRKKKKIQKQAKGSDVTSQEETACDNK